MAVLPNCIIAGAPKCSTSSLFSWLRDHPQVCAAREKETYYFVDPGTHMFRPDRNFRDHGLEGYGALFASCDPGARIVLEATPSYLYSATALRELPDIPSRPTFIFVLREPVAQLRSLFSYFQQNWNWIPRDMTFSDFIAAVEQRRHGFSGNELAVNALRNSWYPEHLRRWRARVGEDRMVILLFDDLVTESRRTMRNLAERLGIEPGFYDDYSFPRENSTYLVRNTWLQDINIRVRGRLPAGAVYRGIRRAYRALNTRQPDSAHDHSEVEQRLRERYSGMIPELESEFGLDLHRWKID